MYLMENVLLTSTFFEGKCTKPVLTCPKSTMETPEIIFPTVHCSWKLSFKTNNSVWIFLGHVNISANFLSPNSHFNGNKLPEYS